MNEEATEKVSQVVIDVIDSAPQIVESATQALVCTLILALLAYGVLKLRDKFRRNR